LPLVFDVPLIDPLTQHGHETVQDLTALLDEVDMQDPPEKNTEQHWRSFDRILANPYTPLVVIASVALLVHLPNLLNYPAWFFDEGAYLTFSNEWLRTGQLTYYGHPFVPLAVLAAMFATADPASYLIPRILMTAFSAVDGVVLYKIGRALYSRGEGFALVASLIYVASPLSARYLRLVVVDNFLALFLLLSFFVIVTRPKDRILSSTLFGAALASKQTALFFVPAMLFYFHHQKRRLADTVVWLLLAAIIPALWILFGVSQVGLDRLIASQFELTALGGERAVDAGALILQRITSRDPFIFVGLAGVVWALYRKDWIVVFPLSYLALFVALFLKISVVYLIPVLPFFSLLAAALLFDALRKIPRISSLPKLRPALLGSLIVALAFSSLFLVSFQNPANPQQQALSHVAGLGTPTVVVSYTYLWLISQNYPGITAYDRYYVPWAQLANQTVYLIVDYPGDLVTINSIPEYREIYAASLSTARNFTDPASGYTVQVLYGVVASS
jgi:4-amino-4-deoxy-L-arabinose transferase-like glycosyltransferase